MGTRALTPLAAAREAAGHTQETFAAALKVERSTIGRWERGVQSPKPWQRHGLADALGVSLGELDNLLHRTTRRPETAVRHAEATERVQTSPEPDGPAPLLRDTDGLAPAADVDVIHAAIPRLRRALDRLDLPDDGSTRTPANLRGEIVLASDDRLQSRYRSLAYRLPGLIAEIARAGQRGDATDRRHAATLLTLALRAADGIAFKFGYLDLSARLIDLMRSAAQRAEDPLLVAAVAYVRTETFFATGDLGAAARALELAADQLPALDTASSSAAFGALHMRAAVVAARAGKPDRAADHLREARRAAAVVPEGVYHGTVFGPASLRIHDLAVAVESRDPAGIERAAAWQPPDELPAERRSHYFIDLARAQLTLGRHQDAYLCLQAARRSAPEHTRAHPQVRRSLSALLRTHPAPSSQLLDLAAWARAR
ncbi:helix-turn-helix domain-containing protein [Amycolatopsis sp. PS_44_ISF1]|uniref:helix-turn-helix domain-containing protein n=1 Tax=Amycolatopsis sp. PS_44_ISF1 TaxID=2974917 RepID=UPI0028E08BF2|nr:helix-turn-helix domain-containing protein [Amycolatopsis sp. PS_44_ISF1]MDT8915122.1 helix-turn-helix domain-containing protein [Amycolatopsis sp. PS_44_ISF1]